MRGSSWRLLGSLSLLLALGGACRAMNGDIGSIRFSSDRQVSMKLSTFSMPQPLDVAAHARRVVRHAVDHPAVGLGEEVVVLEEVDVPAARAP